MMLTKADIEWLADSFPSLRPDSLIANLEGEIAFCAAFDRVAGQLRIGDGEATQALDTFLCDTFTIGVDLMCLDANGWPRVWETSGRASEVAVREDVAMIDLHFYADGACCLGIRSAPQRGLKIDAFLNELVIPFLYRLSYTTKYGVDAARNDLWGEYSHGDEGHRDYKREMLRLAGAKAGRNGPCPCGSGRKYKRCHLDEVEGVAGARWRMPD